MTASVYIAYHKASPMIEGPSFKPMHVGRANAAAPLAGMIGDDTGDNISAQNGPYCELTALYWAWKNDKTSTHIGLMHYRRLLDFTRNYPSGATEKKISGLRSAEYVAASEAWIAANPDIDFVLPKPHSLPFTVRQDYDLAHRPEDLNFVEQVVERDHPEYLPEFRNVINGKDVLLANMFFARKSIMDEYCAFLFDVLGKLKDADISRKYYSTYQNRYLGFISERLFTVFVRKYVADHPATRVHYVNIINLANTTVYPYINDESLNGPENVNIAFSSDDAYLPHAAAMMASAAEFFSPDRVYNLFYLYSGGRPHRMDVFTSIVRNMRNVRLHVLEIGEPFRKGYRFSSSLPSSATYNRFLLFELLPKLNRILYLDCDMTVRGDLAEIFDIDMGDKKLAAVPDFIMTRTLTTKVVTPDPGVPDLYVYQRDKLGMNDEQIHSYFNAGLILFNFAAMDVLATGKELVARAQQSKYFFQDQDLLNSYFKDSYLRLPAKYNVFNSSPVAYLSAPVDNQKEAMAAKADPFIIHYAASFHKPWEVAEVEYAQYYWDALQKTPYLMTVIAEARRTGGDNGIFSKGFWIARARALTRRYPWLRPYLHKIYRRVVKRKV